MLALLVLGGASWGWERLRPYPPARRGDAQRGAAAFMDSTLGSERYRSIPRAVWEAIPVLLPDLLPEGWRGVGLLPRPEDPQGPPVGMVRARVLGLEMYATNCALCHVGSHEGRLLVGAPNADLDIQYMVWVLEEALRSDSFTLEAVTRVAAARGSPVDWLQREELRLWMTVGRQMASRKPGGRFAGTAGPGRSDNLNGYKRMFGLPEGDHAAMVDLADVYNQKRKTRALIDGSITGDQAARIVLTELQKGRPARDALLRRGVFEDLVAYMEGPLEPPRFPYAVDATLANRGHAVFRQTCAKCHGTYAPDEHTYPNLRVPVATVGTDPERAVSMSAELAQALRGYDFREYLQVDPKLTYMPAALRGIWASAPYLHNGSVPTLWHLLHPDARPAAFYRRWNAFDPSRVGLTCAERNVEGRSECDLDATQRAHDLRTVSRFDTRERGNGNAGHRYGESLAEGEKLALLEYLKTI